MGTNSRAISKIQIPMTTFFFIMLPPYHLYRRLSLTQRQALLCFDDVRILKNFDLLHFDSDNAPPDLLRLRIILFHIVGIAFPDLW